MIHFVFYAAIACLFMGYFWSQSKRSQNHFESEKESHAKLASYRLVVDAIPGLVSFFDKDLKYILVNQKVVESLGFPENEILGKPLGFSRATEFQRVVEQFAHSKKSQQAEKMQINLQGDMRWFIVYMTRLPDEKIIVVSTDVDDHMKAEDMVQHHRQNVEATSRMVAIGELAAGIAHEINNPIAVITSKAEQLMRKLQAKGLTEFMADLEKIKTTGFRIAGIVRGLKNLSRNSDADPFVDARISDIAKDVLAIFAEKFRNYQVTLNIQISDAIILPCRPTQIGQVIMNLVSNSFDELKDKPDSWIRVECVDAGQNYEIAVIDSGPGIPPEVREKLMRPFFTTKAAGVGTGLGLSISKRIAVDHGGDFFLDEKSKNTRFVVRLPKSRSGIKAA